jgi:hypothetical protein
VQDAHAVAEEAFDLERANQLGNAFEYLVLGESSPADRENLVIGGTAASCFVHLVADQRDRFRVVQAPALGQPAAGKLGSGKDGESIELGGSKTHGGSGSRQ